MLLLYLISLYSSLASLGHKGRKRLKKSQLKKPAKDSPIQKIFFRRFRKYVCPKLRRRNKKFQGEFNRFIHGTVVNKK